MNYIQDDKDAIAQILQQAPEHIDIHQAKMAYYNAKRDVGQALANLWELPPLPEKPKPVGVDAEKWKEMRELCDEFDTAANQALATMRKNAAYSQQNQILESPIVKIHNLETVGETETETETETEKS